MQDPTYPLVPIANVFAAILVILTLVTSGVRGAYNRGVVMFEGWVLVGLVITAVQTIIWRNTAKTIAPVFCDICAYLGLTLLFARVWIRSVLTLQLTISVTSRDWADGWHSRLFLRHHKEAVDYRA